MAEAFAVYSADDNSLRFYKRDTVPTTGETFEGRTATEVYTGVETWAFSAETDRPYNSLAASITTVSVEDKISPISMASWFWGCTKLVNVSVQNLDTSKVTDMCGTFGTCTALEELDLSGFNAKKVTTFNGIFIGCSSLKRLNLSGFRTRDCTDYARMFYSCGALVEIDLSCFDTTNATGVGGMFSNAKALTTIYVSSLWDMANVTTSSAMFKNCTSLVGDIPFDSTAIDATYATYEGGYLTFKPYVPEEYQCNFRIRGETLYDIAEAIREKTESTDTVAVTDMASKIAGITTGGNRYVRHSSRFIIGTSTNGWTSSDCDYLCDGVDDQVEINAAIEALPSAGGQIVILDGTYSVSASITMSKPGITLIGSGWGTMIQRNKAAFTNGVLIDILRGSDGCVVSNLKIDGQDATAESGVDNKNYGIRMSSSYNTVEHVYACNIASVGIYVYGSSTDPSIVIGNHTFNNTVENSNHGVGFFGALGCVSLNDRVINPYYSGIYIFYSSDSIVENAVVEGGSSTCGIRIMGTSRHNIVSGNCVRNTQNTGIQITPLNAGCVVEYNMIINNQIYNSMTEGVFINSANGCLVNGNIVTRGSGTSSDYTSSQNTIKINASTKCVITGNMTLGKGCYSDTTSTSCTFLNNIV